MATKKTRKRSARKAATKSATRRRTTAGDGAAIAARTDMPYVLNTGRLQQLFEQIQRAAVPPRVTVEFLRRLGFTSSNDRAFPSLLRRLGFVDASGVPAERYRAYRNPAESSSILAESVREAYAELFALNEQVHEADQATVRGLVSRATGGDARQAARIASTFVALRDLGDFSAIPLGEPVSIPQEETPETSPERPPPARRQALAVPSASIAFRHNIEIHLPATTDIAVYNAIFRSIKDHLLAAE